MHDILSESPIYQEILQEGWEKGRAEGRAEGLGEGIDKGTEKGREALRQLLINIVQGRFPSLVRLAKGQASAIDDLETLQEVTFKVSTVQTIEEAKDALIEWALKEE